MNDSNLLVGAEHFSDAGVYRITESTAIAQSVDFFPPVVDDPYVYGQIAAANSLSDLYAMGAEPKTALNIVGFPDDKIDLHILQTILRGGAERMTAAGGVIVGGHSVRDTEIKYGLAVTGVLDPQTMMSNDAARPGDVLVLTKALGTGFITTAHRAGDCESKVLETACNSMVQLNAAAAQAAVKLGARAATDITGFGLGGHASEMARASNQCLHIDLGALPLLPGAEALARTGHHSRANDTNRAFAKTSMQVDGDPDPLRLDCLFDPQTSGGLLLAIAADKAQELIDRCRAEGMEATAVVGKVTQMEKMHLVVA